MSRHHVLIVDDEKVQAAILQEILTSEGIGVTALSDSAKALDLIKETDFDLVVTDLRMPQIGGLELLRSMKALKPSLTVIVMTAYGTIETAVQAMREGAYDYVTKPFSKDEFLMTIRRAIKSIEMENENRYLKGELGLKYQTGNILGKSQPMQNVLRLVSRVSLDDKATVLITGETGTGKSVVARTIHYNSARKEAPFIEVNCAAIPEGLLESEFFGHEKGAFTGATAHRVGRFELADRGTLFLDEVAEMNAQLQGKFLHVIETRAFERVGGTKTVKVDVRIIAATNRNLQEEVKAGRFRGDLFYRLNVIPIHLPPLRERLEDIPILVEHFLEKFRREGRGRVQISPEAIKKLMDYDYPGNVRELENLLERAVILSDGGIVTPDELYLAPAVKSVPAEPPQEPSQRAFKLVGRQAVETAERTIILEALRRHHWNKSRVAEELGIDYKTLRMKIKRYEIDREI